MTGRTIVYLPNWIGDMVMAVPFLRSLRASLKRGELWGIGKTSAMHLYNGLELFDRFILYDNKGFLPFLNAAESLKNTHFERGIMLPHSFRSALLFYGSHVKERTGYARNRRGFMLTHRVPEGPRPEPTVDHYLRIIDTLGSRRLTDTPVLSVTADEEQRFDERHLDINRPYAVFIAGAQYGPSKRWPDTHFSELADMVVRKTGMDVYILPGKNETVLAEGIREGTKEKDRVHVKDLDIMELKVCISRASVVVSNDTGPRHIAVALSVPTIVLLGPMDEHYTRYPNSHTHPVFKDLPCRPCNKKRCDRDHECLKGIKPEDVFKKMEDILNG